MIEWADIQRYCDAIAREFKPRRIVVFGSYAYGRPTEDSDVDVMVVMPFSKKCRTRPSLAIRRRIAAGFPVDILVREPGRDCPALAVRRLVHHRRNNARQGHV